jgi:hypothetical protein
VEDHPREDVCAAISATDPQTSVFTFASGLPVPAAILAVLDDTRPKTLERFDILPGTVKPLACPHSFSRGRLYVRSHCLGLPAAPRDTAKSGQSRRPFTSCE